MRAAVYDHTGPAEEVLSIVELPEPTPGAGEVRVRLAWSGVNPSDVKTRSGLRSRTLPFPRIIPHSDGAGVIDAVGPGVDAARVGERVWTWNAAWGRAEGTAAEFVVLPSMQAVVLPPTTDLAAGACLGIPALTAYHAVTCDGGVSGASVLIAGGAGAVGHYAIQLARLEGAKLVIATVSGPEKAALAKDAGADLVINYKSEHVGDACRAATGGAGVDRVIEVDVAANIVTDIDAVRAGGDVIAYGSGALEVSVPFAPAIIKGIRVSFFIVYKLTPEDRRRAVTEVTKHLTAGRLAHNIAARLPLAQIVEAHRLVESGRAVGNVILQI